MFELRQLSDADLNWPDAGDPSFVVGAGSYPRSVTVRPKPMYPHDVAIVRETLAHCESVQPLVGSPSTLFVLDRDFTTGFNGLAMPDVLWKRPDGTDWDVKIPDAQKPNQTLHLNGLALAIVLAGKSVPLLPSWTSYLVGHEYGHCAWYHARRLLGFTEGGRNTAEAEYMRVRGHADWKDGKRWHDLAVEIIANDWRVLAGIEVDFWQHEIPPPTNNTAIIEWWERAGELSAKGHPDDDHTAVAAKREAAKATEPTT